MAGYHAYWSSILLNMPPRYGNAPLTLTPGIYIKTNIFGPTGSTGQGAGAAVSDHGGSILQINLTVLHLPDKGH